MGQDPGTGSAAVTDNQDPEQIQSEIEQTREELGDTVEALAQKTDVKTQVKQKLDDTKASVAGVLHWKGWMEVDTFDDYRRAWATVTG